MRNRIFGRITSILLFVLLLATLPTSWVLAASSGPNDAGAGANLPGTGTEVWQNPENITVPGSPYASVSLYHLHLYSNYLQGSDYGFAIPTGATINGIEVSINRMSDGRNPNIIDTVVSLVKNGAIVGDNKYNPAVLWPKNLTVATYGGPTDLWGVSWTPEEINAADFGVVLAARRDNNGNNIRNAAVDFMRITVYYAEATSTSVACGDGTPLIYGENLTCVATVTNISGSDTPTGTVSWNTDASGEFETSPCTLSGSDGVAACSVSYTPRMVGDGSHLITASYNGNVYFAPSNGYGSVVVDQRPITATADPQTKVYGLTDPAFTYQITAGSLVFSDTFTGTLTRVAGENVGLYAIQQGTLALSDNYTLTYIGDFLSITQADPTCTVTGYSITYDSNSHTAIGSCTGVFNEPLDGLDLSATTHTSAGNYLSDPWNFTDVNGNYHNDSGTVDDYIARADAACTVTPYSVTYDGNPHTAGGECLGVDGSLLAGLDLSATTHTNVGDYPNDPWSFTDVSGNYKNVNGNVDDKISPILITVTADAQTKSYGSPDPQLTFQITSGSLLYPDIFSGTLVRELGEFPGTYAIMQGTLSLPDYYVLTYVGSHLTITGVNYYLPLVLIK